MRTYFDLVTELLAAGHTKDYVALRLNVSRPTLDKILKKESKKAFRPVSVYDIFPFPEDATYYDVAVRMRELYLPAPMIAGTLRVPMHALPRIYNKTHKLANELAPHRLRGLIDPVTQEPPLMPLNSPSSNT